MFAGLELLGVSEAGWLLCCSAALPGLPLLHFYREEELGLGGPLTSFSIFFPLFVISECGENRAPQSSGGRRAVSAGM